MIKPFEFLKDDEDVFIKVDDWEPEQEDMIFNHTKGAIFLPVSKFFNIEDHTGLLDMFVLTTKRCYNSPELRPHFVHYLNYFLKFYDKDKELLMHYYRIKYFIDYEPAYSEDAFKHDLFKHLLSSTMLYKIRLMNNENFSIDTDYKNNKNPVLKYNNFHAMVLMEISLVMKIIIPLLTHFIYKNGISNVKTFLLKIFDEVIYMHHDSVDIYNKLYETAISNINSTINPHQKLWEMQDIRGKNPTTHGISTVNTILLQIMPKYKYNENMIHYNYKAVRETLRHQITDIGYEFNYISLSSSKRDEDNNSEFDKYESHLIKQNEALYIQNKVNCEDTMKILESQYGPFDDLEVAFYEKELTKGGKQLINSFQKDLILYLFYKYFGDTISTKAINSRDYIKLMLSAKKILESNNMVVLPYILSSRVVRVVTRKNINKKELIKLEASSFYSVIQDKYRNPKIEKQILSIIAMILSSEFEMIDYVDTDLNGLPINIVPELITEEVLMYITLI